MKKIISAITTLLIVFVLVGCAARSRDVIENNLTCDFFETEDGIYVDESPSGCIDDLNKEIKRLSNSGVEKSDYRLSPVYLIDMIKPNRCPSLFDVYGGGSLGVDSQRKVYWKKNYKREHDYKLLCIETYFK